MTNEVTHLSLAGHALRFATPEHLYPVNQYQSLVLATTSEVAALWLAARRGCSYRALSAWEPCCGGGPVAVTLKRMGLGRVVATDLNDEALAACRANAARNGVTLDDVRAADMLEDGDGERYDLIACNPPCGVGGAGPESSDAMRVAVQGGAGGLGPTHRLLAQAAARLTPGGSLVLVVVSTGDVRRLAGWLDETFPNRWRTLPPTPVAAPYAPIDSERARRLTSADLGHRPMIWEKPDRWIWRLTWVIEAAAAPEHPSLQDERPARTGFALCPFGYEVGRDPPLSAMIKEFSDDGIWLTP